MKKRIVTNIYLYVLPMIALFCACIYRLGETLYPVIYGDEYGYWAAGSFFAGLHWEEITTINKYYGYGYGIFLSLILKIVKNPILDYKIALYFNAIALSMSYIFVFKTVEILFKIYQVQVKNMLKINMTLFVVSYPAFIQYVSYTWAEIPIMLFTWIGVWLVVKCIEEEKQIDQCMLLLVSIVLVAIHLRNVGFLLCTIAFLIKINIKFIKTKKILYLAFTAIIGTAIFLILENLYKGNYYVDLNGVSHDTGNEATSAIQRLIMILTPHGIKYLCFAFLGKLYYLVVATYGLATIPILSMTKILRNLKRKSNLNKADIIIIFSVVLTLLMMGICCVSLSEYNTRFDLLLYGRYFENCIPIIMLLGIVILYKQRELVGIRFLGIIMLIISIISKIAEKIQNYNLPKGNVFCNLTPVAKWLIQREYSRGTYIIVGMFATIIFCLIFILITKEKMLLLTIFLLLLFVYNVQTGLYVRDNGLYSWAIEENESDLNLVDVIVELGIQNQLNYYSDGYPMQVCGIQYLLKYNTIKVIGEINGEEYILTSLKNKNGLEEYGYSIIEKSKRLILWKKLNQ